MDAFGVFGCVYLGMASCTEIPPESTLDLLRGISLTEEQARDIVSRGEEAVVFVLFELSKGLAGQQRNTAADSHQTPGTPAKTVRASTEKRTGCSV